jgi:hypothetical protein
MFTDHEGDLSQIELNTVIRSKDRKVTGRKMGEAQQAMQMLLFKKAQSAGKDPPNVHDVFLIGISYLGQMTEEEFYTPPEEATSDKKLVEMLNPTNDPFSVQ